MVSTATFRANQSSSFSSCRQSSKTCQRQRWLCQLCQLWAPDFSSNSSHVAALISTPEDQWQDQTDLTWKNVAMICHQAMGCFSPCGAKCPTSPRSSPNLSHVLKSQIIRHRSLFFRQDRSIPTSSVVMCGDVSRRHVASRISVFWGLALASPLGASFPKFSKRFRCLERNTLWKRFQMLWHCNILQKSLYFV